MHRLEVTRATLIDQDYLEQIEEATVDDTGLFELQRPQMTLLTVYFSYYIYRY